MKIIKSVLLIALLSTLLSFAIQASDSALTPLPGDPLRKQVLDALRHEMKRMHGLEVVFVVKYLKVKDGWAWVHTLPQSPDGKARYEDLLALLQFQDGEWKVAEIPCNEVDNPKCLDGPNYFEQLLIRFPGVSAELFPGTPHKPE